jgi:uncharacterized membrane protein required for colicin V production
MALLDMLIAAYLGWGFYRGRQRGLRVEGIRIIGLLIVLALFLGFGLFAVVGNSLTALADTLLQRRGIAVTVLLLVATLLIVVTFRKRLRHQRENVRPTREPPLHGGIAGVLRTVLSLGIILSGLDFLLPDFLNRAILGDSMAGQALETLKGLCLTT